MSENVNEHLWMFKEVEDGMCPKCGKNPAQEPHMCPYQIDINDDYSLCTCCEECEGDCLGDI